MEKNNTVLFGILITIVSIVDATIYNSTGYFLVGLGVLVSIRFLGYPDLTVDGSFTLGAALYAVGVKYNLPVVLCFLFALAGGAAAGTLTAFVNNFLKIGKIISGVIVMIAIIAIVPYITGGSTIGLMDQRNFLGSLQTWDIVTTTEIIPGSLHIGFSSTLIILCSVAALAVYWLFNTRLGVEVRYLGSSVSAGILAPPRKKFLAHLGLALGNCLVALGGAVEATRNGAFNQNMGVGVLLIGLSVLILGESILKTRVKRDNLYVGECILAILSGVLVYSLGIQILLNFGIAFVDVRLTATVLLLALLTFAARKHPNTGKLF